MNRRILLSGAVGAAVALATAPIAAASLSTAGPTAYDFTFDSIDGGRLALAAFTGRPILLVNTASFCGYTYQYEGLEALWQRYRDGGLVVLGVPSGDFGGQEYASNGEVKDFCESTFAIDFPMTAIEHVVGADAHPLYRWLAGDWGAQGVPRWNFHKVLFDRSGKPAAAWPSGVRPESPEVRAAIEAQLGR